MQSIIKTENLRKTYGMGDIQVHALDGVDVLINEGEFVATFLMAKMSAGWTKLNWPPFATGRSGSSSNRLTYCHAPALCTMSCCLWFTNEMATPHGKGEKKEHGPPWMPLAWPTELIMNQTSCLADNGSAWQLPAPW